MATSDNRRTSSAPDSTEGTGEQSRLTLARRIIREPIVFGYMIREFCRGMEESFREINRELDAEQAQESHPLCPSVLKDFRHARTERLNNLERELLELIELGNLTREKSSTIERFLTGLRITRQRGGPSISHGDLLGMTVFPLRAIRDALRPPIEPVELFAALRSNLSAETEAYISRQGISDTPISNEGEGPARNRDGQVTESRILQVKNAIQKWRDEHAGRDPKRTELKAECRYWEPRISNGALTSILNQLNEEGFYSEKARKRTIRKRL